MNTTHVIVFSVADPEALRLYTNESFLLALTQPSAMPFTGVHDFNARANLNLRAADWFWEGFKERTIEGVTFVRRSVR